MIVNVYINIKKQKLLVGKVWDDNGLCFQYNTSFLQKNINISPITMPLTKDLIKIDNPNKSFGIFWDYTPSGYHLDLLYKLLRDKNIAINDFVLLKKISMTSLNAIGAIEFEPSLDYSTGLPTEQLNLDEIAQDIQGFFGEETKSVVKLLALNSSINGHTPKINVFMSSDKKTILAKTNNNELEEWIVKIPKFDDSKLGAIEYVYSVMAKNAGIEVSNFTFLPSNTGNGFFASKRFDRIKGEKLHVLSACALLDKDFIYDNIYFEDLFNLTAKIAPQDVQELFKLYVFYKKSGNNDFRGQNISFIMKDNNEWSLAPAYDLTPSDEIDQLPAFINGQDKNITDNEIYQMAEIMKIDKSLVNHMIKKTEISLAKYTNLISKLL